VAAGERLLPAERLRRREEFRRCYSQGLRRHGALLTLHFVASPAPHPRFGITASRKVGAAARRNLQRRRIRETIRRWPGRHSLPPLDVVVHVKPAAAAAAYPQLRDELVRLLTSLTTSAGAGPRRRSSSP
jgi:ribonuclease P protein component